MIAVDTNVLIRILVDDPDATLQMQSARALLAKSEVLYVPQIVQVDLILTESINQQLKLFTFDKKLSRLKGAANP